MIDRPDFRNRLSFSAVLYHTWIVLACFCACAAMWCLVFGAWTWVLGWVVGAVSLSAHARLERLDGHKHRGWVEVP